MGLLDKFVTWVIDTYWPDAFVPREDFDHVQAREFPIVQRDIENLRQHCDHLQRENYKLVCDGLHNHAFLPRFIDADEGQITTDIRTFRIRERFRTEVCVSVSDDYRRHLGGRLRPQVFDYLAQMLSQHIARELKDKFQPPYPGEAP